MVLYHAISSYQLLAVILHKLKYHRNDHAVLVLPDFYTSKMPDVVNIKGVFFDEVHLFPYLEIPHDRRSISKNTAMAYQRTVSRPVTEFDYICIAGAQFYFTDYLIKNKVRFDCIEEAAGLYSRPEVLKKNIDLKFPIQGKWAKKNKILDFSNTLIDNVLCCIHAQKEGFKGKKMVSFDVSEELDRLCEYDRDRIIDFFCSKRYEGEKNAVIVMTEQFANLGQMSQREQEELYIRMYSFIPDELKIYVKAHPDDKTDYLRIFKCAEMIENTFPAELLPYVFRQKPEYITTVSSTGVKNLKSHFKIVKYI